MLSGNFSRNTANHSYDIQGKRYSKLHCLSLDHMPVSEPITEIQRLQCSDWLGDAPLLDIGQIPPRNAGLRVEAGGMNQPNYKN